ncbi:MAG: hypothetical protein M3Q42_10290 [Pseudomonadota bacterium]|nr:hypothetical protein [Pseudomonadota bacterium]
MSHPSSRSPSAKPVAIAIAAQMRNAMPRTAQPHRPAPVNVKRALKHAGNSSPAAKAALKRAAPAVKAATPHLKALAQPGKGVLSSLRHGVSAMRSLRQVTREMGKAKSAAPPMSGASPVASAFKSAAAASPAAAAAFKRAGPAVAKAQRHVQALSKLVEAPNPSLLSSLGHGIQAMRALRQVTKGMRGTSGFAPIESASIKPASIKSAHGASHASQSGHASTQTFQHASKHASPANAIDHRALLVQLRQQITSAHGAHADGHNGTASSPGTQASTPFAAMLIVRRNTRALSSFKQRT